MTTVSSRNSIIRTRLKKEIMNLKGGSASNLSEAYLDSLSLRDLKNIYIIARTMGIKKEA